MVKVALVGCGYWGKNVGRSLLKSKMFSLNCICDNDEGNLSEAKGFFGNGTSYETDYKKVASRDDIDGVAIATQTSTHFDIAKEFLKNGKHVYVEKPATLTSKESDKLYRLSKDKGLVLHVDHIMIYSPAIQIAKKIIDDGDLGSVLHIDCSRANLGIARRDVNAMWDLGIHDLSIVDYFLNGEMPREIHSVGNKGSFVQETTTSLSLRYKKTIATIRASWISPTKERKIVVYGSKKSMVIDDTEPTDKVTVYSKALTGKGEADVSGDSVVKAVGGGEPLLNSLEHFGKCIQENKESVTNAKSATRLLKILEMADKQMEN